MRRAPSWLRACPSLPPLTNLFRGALLRSVLLPSADTSDCANSCPCDPATAMSYNKMDGSGGGGSPLDGQVDWGGNGGKIYECWVVAPCCDGYCCVTWFCCGCFNACKVCDVLRAQLTHSSADVRVVARPAVFDCEPLPAVHVPRGLCGVLDEKRHQEEGRRCRRWPDEWIHRRLPVCLLVCTPNTSVYNVSRLAHSLGACSYCQELRAAHTLGGKGAWDFFGDPKPEVMTQPFKFPPFME